MKSLAQLSHVAFLVASVEKTVAVTQSLGFLNGPAEHWEGEGTLEIYVGAPEKTARLLLMEAAHEGAYRRAFQKRGPGLHHLAIDVVDLESYIEALSSSGWLLHPRSLKTMKATQTAYLARPGVPTLIEVQGREALSSSEPFITRVELPFRADDQKLLSSLGVPEFEISQERKLWLTAEGVRFEAF